ncbi:hypothetical protein ACEF17_10165 [Streptococcus hyovaginalis]
MRKRNVEYGCLLSLCIKVKTEIFREKGESFVREGKEKSKKMYGKKLAATL